MACKKKTIQLTDEIIEKVKKFFEDHPEKSWRAWQIAEELGLEKELVSAAIKKLKDEWVITWRCAYKIAG